MKLTVEQTSSYEMTDEVRVAVNRMAGLLLRAERRMGFYTPVVNEIPSCQLFIAHDGGKIVGMMSMRAPGGDCLLEQVYVLKRWRRRGVGSALFRAVLIAVGVGNSITIEVAPSNVGAQRFYQSMGCKGSQRWVRHGDFFQDDGKPRPFYEEVLRERARFRLAHERDEAQALFYFQNDELHYSGDEVDEKEVKIYKEATTKIFNEERHPH